MAEFKRTHSMERYEHDVERELAMLRAKIDQADRAQATRMWNAQRNEGKDWVVYYVRDCVTSNLLHTFQVPLNTNGDERREFIGHEMERLRRLYPMQSDRMMVCHE